MKSSRWRLLGHCKITLSSLAVFGGLLYFDLKYDLDFSSRTIEFVHDMEKLRVDEIAICAVVILLGIIIDGVVLLNWMAEKRRLHAARMEVMEKALLKTQHIVNNYLNEMLMFKIELEKYEHLPRVEIERFGAAIYRAAEELEKIENLEDLYINLSSNSTTDAPSKSPTGATSPQPDGARN